MFSLDVNKLLANCRHGAFEFGLIVAGKAFHRGIIRFMAAAGLKDLTLLEVLVLHHVTYRVRDKRLADLTWTRAPTVLSYRP